MDDILYYNENYVYDEDLERIGQYEDPDTGEMHWVEPASFNDDKFVISEDVINLLGNSTILSVKYDISYNQGDHFVSLASYCIFNDVTYANKELKIDLKAFCDEIAHLALADLNLTDSQILKECKSLLKNKLIDILFDNSILVSAFEKTGLGFAIVEGNKITTIESISVYPSADDKNNVIVELKDCIGAVDLKNMENVIIKFNTPEHIISFNNFTVLSTKGSRIKSYVLQLNDVNMFSVNKQDDNNIDYNRPKDEDEFILKRSQLLNQENEDDDILDDRFNDDDFFM